MFSSLKDKVKAKTGAELQLKGPHYQYQLIPQINHANNSKNDRISDSSSSINSIGASNDIDRNGLLSVEYLSLRNQCNDLTTKVIGLTKSLRKLQEDKTQVEKSNEILLESVKAAQTQRDFYCEEQQKMQKNQQIELGKLRNLLAFRDQEALDRLELLRQNQNRIDDLNEEVDKLKTFPTEVENLKDELQRLQHTSEQEKINLKINLAAIEEENSHLKKRLEIYKKVRMKTIRKLNESERLQVLINEYKLLEEYLEEAHLQLTDIKSSWSGQNLSLETQVNRLSKQVTEEAMEKHKAIAVRDDLNEKIQIFEFNIEKLKNELQQKNDKIDLLEDEIDQLKLALNEMHKENTLTISMEKNKITKLEIQNYDLKTRLSESDERLKEYRNQNELAQKELNEQIIQLNNQLKKQNFTGNDEMIQYQERQVKLENDLKEKDKQLHALLKDIELKEMKIKEITEMENDLNEKNKIIKNLNQHLVDLKKSLQNELHGKKDEILNNDKDPVGNCIVNDINATTVISAGHSTHNVHIPNGTIVMDEIGFKYLRHVIIKFLTSRSGEARNLIRAVATVLKLSNEEEKLLHDILKWKMSWFGSKPDQFNG